MVDSLLTIDICTYSTRLESVHLLLVLDNTVLTYIHSVPSYLLITHSYINTLIFNSLIHQFIHSIQTLSHYLSLIPPPKPTQLPGTWWGRKGSNSTFIYSCPSSWWAPSRSPGFPSSTTTCSPPSSRRPWSTKIPWVARFAFDFKALNSKLASF